MDNRSQYYPICDGFAYIGYGFQCVSCGKHNQFVDENKKEHKCIYCGFTNKFPKG